MKERVNFTISTESMAFLRDHLPSGDRSLLIDKLIGAYRKQKTESTVRLLLLNDRCDEIVKERDQCISEIERIKIEGNIKEREEAENALREQKRREKVRLREAKKKYTLIKDHPLFLKLIKKHKNLTEITQGVMDELLELGSTFQSEGIKVGATHLSYILLHLKELQKK